jgi:hypothetical protein
MRRPLAVPASDAPPVWATFTGGAAGEHAAQNVAAKTASAGSAEAGPSIYCRTLIEDCDKKGIQTIYSLTRV